MSPRAFSILLERFAAQERRRNMRAALVAATVARCLTGQDIAPSDFLGESRPSKPAQTIEEQISIFQMFEAAQDGGK
jgi:hypothetical protein